MALSRNSTAITWAASASVSVTAGSNQTSDAVTFNAGTVAAAIQVDANNAGTPSAGDTVDVYVLWSTGDVLGDTGDDFDTAGHGLYLGQIDTQTADPSRATWPIDIGAKAFKLYTKSNAASNAITVRAMWSDLRSA